jgi:hypothetical protein
MQQNELTWMIQFGTVNFPSERRRSRSSAFGKLDSMFSNLVAKAIVLSSLCATGIVAQTTQANAGPLAGLPCKKALAGTVRGDDACVKIGVAYVWRRLANVNDSSPAAAQPTATAPAPAAQSASSSPATVAQKLPNPTALPDPCRLIDPAQVQSYVALSGTEPKFYSLGDSSELRVCSFRSGSRSSVIAVSKNGKKSEYDDAQANSYLPFGDGTFFFVTSSTGYARMYTDRKGVRIYLSDDSVNTPARIEAMQNLLTATASRL